MMAIGCVGQPTARPIASAASDAACPAPPRATPFEVGINPEVIDSLQRAAEAMKSDAFLIMRDGKVVHEWSYPGFRMPFNPQSITKAITGLGVGVLMDRGRITSLDTPLRETFPEFNTPDKQAVTLRMLMNHTSGLAADRGEAQFMKRGAEDVGAFVRRQPMAEPAGTTFRYNNVGAQLVSHMVQARAAAPLHAVLDSALFAPLCIRDWYWHTDVRGASYGYSRVFLGARDLAKLGQLVLDRGLWNGHRILRAETVDTLTMIGGGIVRELAPINYVGLWQFIGGDSVRIEPTLVARLRDVKASDSLVAAVERLIASAGVRVMSTQAFKSALDSSFGAGQGVLRWQRETRGAVTPTRWRSPAQAVGHSGSWGQMLLVFPETRTVIVRFADWNHPGRRAEDDEFMWGSLLADTYRLLGRR